MPDRKKPEILIIYDSKTGNVEQMAQLVKKGAESEGVRVRLKKVDDAAPKELLEVQGVIVGSPTYYGNMTGRLKSFFDASVEHHGKLDGKVGAAFASSGVLGGGNETTIVSILQCLLVHGMVVQGDPVGGHYGAVSLGSPDEKKEQHAAERLGKRTAALAWKLAETVE
jgi:NAD(P)H dehydrogenase (quinone)